MICKALYQNKLLSSHLQAVEVQNATNKVTFAKSTSSHAFYYTCTNIALNSSNENCQSAMLSTLLRPFTKRVSMEWLYWFFVFFLSFVVLLNSLNQRWILNDEIVMAKSEKRLNILAWYPFDGLSKFNPGEGNQAFKNCSYSNCYFVVDSQELYFYSILCISIY